jgi:putative transposase
MSIFPPEIRPLRQREAKMARAKLCHTSGFVWHLTHRCHNRDFHLKFHRDRRRWLHWLFLARKRYGLVILGYAVTSNHIHLLVYDDGREEVIPRSILLTASRTAREYNLRKSRSGAFWEDHYHATAIDTDTHLARCLVYIDLNMVRAGVVNHPQDWPFCGYAEMMSARQRYQLLDLPRLMELLECDSQKAMRLEYARWIRESLAAKRIRRDAMWTESLAVGGKGFVDQLRERLGARAGSREVEEGAEGDGCFVLREERYSYVNNFTGKNSVLRKTIRFGKN